MRPEGEGGPTAIAASESAEGSPGLQDDDFLAALSRAFKESEEKAKAVEETVAQAEADAKGEAESAAQEVPPSDRD